MGEGGLVNVIKVVLECCTQVEESTLIATSNAMEKKKFSRRNERIKVVSPLNGQDKTCIRGGEPQNYFKVFPPSVRRCTARKEIRKGPWS